MGCICFKRSLNSAMEIDRWQNSKKKRIIIIKFYEKNSISSSTIITSLAVIKIKGWVKKLKE